MCSFFYCTHGTSSCKDEKFISLSSVIVGSQTRDMCFSFPVVEKRKENFGLLLKKVAFGFHLVRIIRG